MNEWLTIKDVIEIYGLKERTQYNMRKNKEIPFIRMGGTIKYHKKTLDKFFMDKMSDNK